LVLRNFGKIDPRRESFPFAAPCPGAGGYPANLHMNAFPIRCDKDHDHIGRELAVRGGQAILEYLVRFHSPSAPGKDRTLFPSFTDLYNRV
jgi:hypothetical protein